MTGSDATANSTGAPLAGRSVVVTRTAEQARELAEPLRALGAEVVACPVIAIVDPPEPERIGEAIAALTTYDWVVLTSTNAVDRFLGHRAFGGDAAARLAEADVKVAAVGRPTAARIERYGVAVDLVPDDYRAEGLVEAFVEMGAGEGWRLLLPRALKAREVLRTELVPRGVTVDVVPVYRTVPATADPEVAQRLATGDFDVVTFTSPSTVRNFIAMLDEAGIDSGEVMRGVVRASIGPVTTTALEAAGFDASVEADPSTMPVLVEAIAAHFAGESGA